MKRTISILLAILLALAATRWLAGRPESPPSPANEVPTATSPAPANEAPTATSPAPPPSAPEPGGELLVRGVTVRDLDGRIAWRGDVDLGPVLARIEAGERDSHRNDGGVFGNREGLLPGRPRGYYREYVVRTPGIAHAGPQRLIVGDGGELFYTADHYATFQRIR